VRGWAGQIVAGVRTRGYEVLGDPNAGIVSFRKPGIDCVSICTRLREHSIITAPRAGWVRASPHFYIEAEDIEKMLVLLP
jgi:selenocysteine lyase/cysteine desulfurase